MRLALKDYQKMALERLRDFLARVTSYAQQHDPDPCARALGEIEGADRNYVHVSGVNQMVPNVCFKIPTGGGKTIMGIEAIEVVAQQLQQREGMVVLWMAPTDRIVKQTLLAMLNTRHPYHEALPEDAVVIPLEKAVELKPQELARTVVIVTTSQSLRVANQDGRKVYEAAGLETRHTIAPPAWEENRDDAAMGAASVANIIRSRRPLVIIDEAHKGRNELLAETLRRFEPCCILELTATPEKNTDKRKDEFASNVLYRVSAQELKDDGMIKLPIHLRAGLDHRELLRQAVACRNELEEKAKREKRYIRPVMLLQGQSRSQEGERVTVETLRGWLLTDLGIPPQQVAVCYDTTDELEGVDVLAPHCELRYILTVDKLREGWDCPFACVLYSVNNVATATAVEQVLGRVLRMPYATKPLDPALGQAYAFVGQASVQDAAMDLADLLAKKCGFDRKEAEKQIFTEEPELFGTAEPDLWQAASIPAVDLPKSVELAVVAGFTEVVSLRNEGKRMEWTAPRAMTEDEREQIVQRVAAVANKAAVRELFWKTQHLGGRLAMRIPQLAVRIDGQCELFEDQFAPMRWRICDADADLTEEEFPRVAMAQAGERIDVTQGGKVEVVREAVNPFAPAQTLFDPGPKTDADLVRFLADNVVDAELFADDKAAWLRRVILSLVQRGVSVVELCLRRYSLLERVRNRVDAEGRKARHKSFTQFLFGNEAVAVGPEVSFEFDPDRAPYVREYVGRRSYGRHYYRDIGFMNDEEAQCAALIDENPKVKRWVRNPDPGIGKGFSLQTSTDRFYPDFIAELKDGRWLLVEYKGELWRDTGDTREKEMIGDIWAKASTDKCLFLLVGKDDMESRLASL